MATNQFFRSSYKSTARDQKLHEALIIESIQIHGIDCNYVPRTLVNFDKLFGEDQSSKFDDAYTMEFYLKNVDGFGGDDKFLSKFGIEVRDEVTLVVARKRFLEEVQNQKSDLVLGRPEGEPRNDIIRPREGDLIQLPPELDSRERLFEISYVSNDEIFYQLGTLQTWEIRCTVFSQAGEEFSTGVESIDSYGEDYYLNRKFTFEVGSGDYIIGESVFVEGTTDRAEVVSWDSNDRELTLTKMIGEFDSGNIIGLSSDASFEILPLSTTNSLVSGYDGVSAQDNDFIDKSRIEIISFNEINPFSE